MSQDKYIGMDVHQASITVAVIDGGGKLIMECVLPTQAGTILEFIQGMRGRLAVTFEEGTCAAGYTTSCNPHASRFAHRLALLWGNCAARTCHCCVASFEVQLCHTGL